MPKALFCEPSALRDTKHYTVAKQLYNSHMSHHAVLLLTTTVVLLSCATTRSVHLGCGINNVLSLWTTLWSVSIVAYLDVHQLGSTTGVGAHCNSGNDALSDRE